MRRLVFGVSFLVVLGFARPGFAQPVVPGGGSQRPTVSPYVNLLRGNGSIGNAALNYFGIVRPEQQFRQQAGMMQQQIAANSQNINSIQSGGGDQPLITGKGATFMNYSHYFNSFGGGGGGMGSFGGGRPGGSFGGSPSIGVGINTGGGGGTAGRGSGMTIQAPQGGGARRR